MTAKSRDNPRGRTRTLKFGIVLALISVILTMWAVVAGSIMNTRRALIETARLDASALARTFGAELAHTFDDIATAGAIIALRGRAAANADLYNWARELPIIDGKTIPAMLVDANGKLIASSGDPHPQPADLGDRPEFRIPAGQTSDALVIGHALVGAPSQFEITVARRIAAADGRLRAVLIFTVSPSRLTNLHDEIRRDGSRPADRGSPGRVAGGRLEIASAKDLGTTVRAYLPPDRVTTAQEAAA